MSLPLVTRFGADPLLDLELANKRYVDSQILVGTYQFFNRTSRNLGGDDGLFWAFVNTANPTATEAPFMVPFPLDSIVQTWVNNVTAKTSANDLLLIMRKNQADTSTVATITAVGLLTTSSTEEFDKDDSISIEIEHVTDGGTVTIRGMSWAGIFR